MAYVVHLSLTFLPRIGYGEMHQHLQAICLSREPCGLGFPPGTSSSHAAFRGCGSGSILNLRRQSAAASGRSGVDRGPSGCSQVSELPMPRSSNDLGFGAGFVERYLSNSLSLGAGSPQHIQFGDARPARQMTVNSVR